MRPIADPFQHPAGCLVPAARRVLERVGDGAHLGLLVCGGNATLADVTRWATA